MPAPKGRYPSARYNQVPEHTEPLCIELILDAPVRVAASLDRWPSGPDYRQRARTGWSAGS